MGKFNFLKNTKIIIAMTFFVLQSCEKEKIVVTKIEGYIFSGNPKNSSAENAVSAILSTVNRIQEQEAAKNNEDKYVGFGLEDKNGKVTMPKIENAEYMLAFNQQQFDEIAENANKYGEKPKPNLDFSKEFVFVLIHPSKLGSGLQFFDGLDAIVENENIIQLKPSFSELPYSQNENQMYNYGDYDCQVSMFKIPKANYKNINILWETGAIENLKMEK